MSFYSPKYHNTKQLILVFDSTSILHMQQCQNQISYYLLRNVSSYKQNILSKLSNKLPEKLVKITLQLMARTGKLVENNDKVQLSQEYRESFTQTNQVQQYPNAVKLFELIVSKLQLGITTKELSELSKIGSQEISRSAKILIENDLVIQLNNVTKMLFWKKVVTYTPLQLELYSQYLFKSKANVELDQVDNLVFQLSEYYDIVLKLLNVNNNLKETQITQALVSDSQINVHMFLQVLVIMNVLSYGKGHYYLPKTQSNQSNLVKQHVIETLPQLIPQFQYYTQDFRLLPFEHQVLRALQNQTLFANQYFYRLFYDKKAHTAYMTMITSKYAQILSLEKEKSQTTVMMCIKSKYERIQQHLEQYKLQFIIQYFNLPDQINSDKREPEAVREENYTKLESKDQVNYHKIQDMLLGIREEKTRLKLKLIGSLLIQQQILTIHQLQDYLNIYLFKLGQLSQFTQEKIMLLIDYFVNAKIVEVTKVDLGQGHIFFINYIIRLSDIPEDSNRYRNFIETLQTQQSAQAESDNEKEESSNSYSANYDDVNVLDKGEEQISTQYFYCSKAQRLCHVYSRVLDVMQANRGVISPQLRPMHLTTDVLIGHLTVLDLLKTFRAFAVMFQADLHALVQEEKLMTPLNQLDYATILRVFINKRLFAQIKQQLTFMLKQLSSYGVLGTKTIEMALLRPEHAITLSALERQRSCFHVLTTQIQVSCRGIHCGTPYGIEQFIQSASDPANAQNSTDVQSYNQQNATAHNSLGPTLFFALKIVSTGANVGGPRVQSEVRHFRRLGLVKSFIYYMVCMYLVQEDPRMQFTQDELVAFNAALEICGENNLAWLEKFKQDIQKLRQEGILKKEIKCVVQRALLIQNAHETEFLDPESLELNIGTDSRSIERIITILQAAMMANTILYKPIKGIDGPILCDIHPNVGYNIDMLTEIICKNAYSDHSQQRVLRKPSQSNNAREKHALIQDPMIKGLIYNYLQIPDDINIQQYENAVGLGPVIENTLENYEAISAYSSVQADQNYCLKKLALNYFISISEGYKQHRTSFCLARWYLKQYNVYVVLVESIVAEKCYYNFCLVSQIMQQLYSKYIVNYVKKENKENVLKGLIQKQYLQYLQEQEIIEDDYDEKFVIIKPKQYKIMYYAPSIFYNDAQQTRLVYKMPKCLKLTELNRLYKLINHDITTLSSQDVNLIQKHLLFKKFKHDNVIRNIKRTFENKCTLSKRSQQMFMQQLIQRVNNLQQNEHYETYGPNYRYAVTQSQHTQSESTAISYEPQYYDNNGTYIDYIYQQSYEDTDVQLEVINEQLQLLEESAFSNATQTTDLSVGTSLQRFPSTVTNPKRITNKSNQQYTSEVQSTTDQPRNIVTMNMYSQGDKKFQQMIQDQQEDAEINDLQGKNEEIIDIIRQNHQEDLQFLKYFQDKVELSKQKPLLNPEDLLTPNATNIDYKELNQLILSCGYFVQIFVDGEIKYVPAVSNIKENYSGSFQIEQLKSIAYEGIRSLLQQNHIIKIKDFVIMYSKIVNKLGIDQILRVLNVLALDCFIVFIDINGIQQIQLKEGYMDWTIKYNSL